MWFDLNSAGDADPVPVRVTEVAPSHRPERVWVEFVSSSGDIGEAHLVADDLVAIMASYDFEEEEW